MPMSTLIYKKIYIPRKIDGKVIGMQSYLDIYLLIPETNILIYVILKFRSFKYEVSFSDLMNTLISYLVDTTFVLVVIHSISYS